MAEIAVNLIIDKLGPLIKEEAYLLKGIHKEVKEIKCDLQYLLAFLRDADVRAQEDQGTNNNHGVKLWVEKLRVAAFEVEDVIDEYTYFMVQLRRSHNNRFLGFICKSACLVVKLKSRHDIASKLQEIKENIQNINKKSLDFGFKTSLQQGSTSCARENSKYDPRKNSRLLKETNVVGIQSSIDELQQIVKEESPRRTVISLVGMGGLGKTTLAQQLYDRTKKHFNCHAWVEVSQSYNKVNLLQKLMKELCKLDKGVISPEIDAMDETTVTTMLQEYLKKKSYLVIFDDIWNQHFWDEIHYALPDDDETIGRVVITTRDENVAKFCKSFFVHIHHLQPLPLDKALELFYNEAFQYKNEERCPEYLNKLSHEIVERCKGLPLAIVVIAGLLSTKGNDVNEWRTLLASLSSELENNQRLKSIPNILLLSYNDLPYNLKQCFLYFGIFPEDYSVRSGRLIKQWIAEGFVLSNNDKPLEVVAEEYLVELINRNLVQVSKVDFDKKARTCQIHDLLHEMIVKKMEDLSICRVFYRKESSFEGVTRRISITNGFYDNVIEGSASKTTQVRSVFIFNKDQIPTSLVSAITGKFKLLKVLDFEDAPKLDHLPQDIGKLYHLKYLSVRGTNISVLPTSIGELENLQTLDLKQTLVIELPAEIKKLRKLRHLLAYNLTVDESTFDNIYRGLKVGQGIGWLKSLQQLFYIEANVVGFDLFKELSKLEELRKLGIYKLGKENGKSLCECIQKMKFLETLDVASTSEDEAIDLELLSSPPQSLQRLCLNGLLMKLPEWVTKLEYVVRIKLIQSKLRDDPLEALQNLHSLLELGLYNDAYHGQELHFKKGGFQKLKVLVLYRLSKLHSLVIDDGALYNLEELTIGSCLKLENSSGFHHLRNMKKVLLIDLQTKFLKHCLEFIQFTRSDVQVLHKRSRWHLINLRDIVMRFATKGDNYDVDWDFLSKSFEDFWEIRKILEVEESDSEFLWTLFEERDSETLEDSGEGVGEIHSTNVD